MVGVAKGGGAFRRSLDHAALAEVKTFYMGREGERERESKLYITKPLCIRLVPYIHVVLRFLKLPIYHKDSAKSAFTKSTENRICDK